MSVVNRNLLTFNALAGNRRQKIQCQQQMLPSCNWCDRSPHTIISPLSAQAPPGNTLAVPLQTCSSCRASRPINQFSGEGLPCERTPMPSAPRYSATTAAGLISLQARRRATGAGSRSASPGKISKSRLTTCRCLAFCNTQHSAGGRLRTRRYASSSQALRRKIQS